MVDHLGGYILGLIGTCGGLEMVMVNCGGLWWVLSMFEGFLMGFGERGIFSGLEIVLLTL